MYQEQTGLRGWLSSSTYAKIQPRGWYKATTTSLGLAVQVKDAKIYSGIAKFNFYTIYTQCV